MGGIHENSWLNPIFLIQRFSLGLFEITGSVHMSNARNIFCYPHSYAIEKFVSQAFQEWSCWFIFSVVCLNKISPNTSFLKLPPFKTPLPSAVLRLEALKGCSLDGRYFTNSCGFDSHGLCTGKSQISASESGVLLENNCPDFLQSFLVLFCLLYLDISSGVKLYYAMIVNMFSPCMLILPETPVLCQLALLQVEEKEQQYSLGFLTAG